MKKRWWFLALAWFLAGSGVAADSIVPPADSVIRLAAGTHRPFAPPFPASRVAVGDHAIADIRVVSPDQLLIQGKRPGFTSLLIWEKKSGGQVRNYFIQVDRQLPPAGDGKPAPLTASGDQLTVQGSFPDDGAHQAALAAARQAAGGDKGAPILDRSTVNAEGQVQVDVQIVEMNRRVLKSFGLNLLNTRDNFTIGVFAPSSLKKLDMVVGSAIGGEYAQPMADAFQLVGGSGAHGMLRMLSVLEKNGMARTLARPSLVVVSGQSASFMAGGEFPIPVAQSMGQVTVTYKPYGIRLQMTPTVFSRERIAVKLAPEVSEIDFLTTVTSGGVSVPGVLTRRADTTIELADGESFVIGGLVSQSMIDNVDKVPLLGDIPILGAFFKSMRYSRQDRELVIIATPHLVRPLAAAAALPPLPGAEYDQYDPSWLRMLFYQRDPFEVESAGFSR